MVSNVTGQDDMACVGMGPSQLGILSIVLRFLPGSELSQMAFYESSWRTTRHAMQ